MAEVAVRFSHEVIDSVGDKEFDEFLGINNGGANGTPSESKVNSSETNGSNGGIVSNGSSSAVTVNANDRIKWKAKRPSSSKFVLSRTNSDSSVAAPLRALKNSRKSRNRFGRGLPKKGEPIYIYIYIYCIMQY